MGPEASLLLAMRAEMEQIDQQYPELGHAFYLLRQDIKRVAANIIAGGFDA